MSAALVVRTGGPHLSVQDLGRQGFLAYGLSRGGAVDRTALFEGAALLGQPPSLAAVEMAGRGGVFEAARDLRIALTGAEMTAESEGRALAWNRSHALHRGATLTIGSARAGTYGYLHVGGGVLSEPVLGSRSAHHAAKLGSGLNPGDVIAAASDPQATDAGMQLSPENRLGGGTLRVVASLQTDAFGSAERSRFEATEFTRDLHGNRMGTRLLSKEAGFGSASGLSVLSEVIVPGDIQIVGDGAPFVLLAECQATGGYPRIGTVIPADLARMGQAAVGSTLRFRFVGRETALEAERAHRAALLALPDRVSRAVRRPEDAGDLLGQQLISGVTAGDDLEGDKP